jgi:site-specific DNA recombinase
LRDEKQRLMLENANLDERKKRIEEMREFMKGQSTNIVEFDEQLVRRLIEKVTVFEDKFTVEFKSELTVNVDEKIDTGF